MNPFQLPLEYSELSKIEELNPEIVLGLQDVKESINGIDNSVLTDVDSNLLNIENIVDSVSTNVASICDAVIEAGLITVEQCDDYIKCVTTGVCDGIDEFIAGCSKCTKDCEPSLPFILTLISSEDFTYDRSFGPNSVGGKFKDLNGELCSWNAVVKYCEYVLGSFTHNVSSPTFAVYKKGVVAGLPNFVVSNCDVDLANLLEPKDYGIIPLPCDVLFSEAIRFLRKKISEGTVNCKQWFDYIPPDDTLPYHGDDTIIGGGGGGDLSKCCPPAKIIINPPVCPPPIITVSPQIELHIDNVSIAAPITEIEGDTIINIDGEDRVVRCPDGNEIDAIVTICGQGRIDEFLEREGLNFLKDNRTLGQFLRMKYQMDEVEELVPLFRS